MNIGVIGAGVMGSGVAQNLAQSHQNIILIDISDEILAKTKQEIINNLRFQRMFGKKENVDDPQVLLDHITFSTEINLLENMDFVIENVIEKWHIKKEVYSKIDTICQKDCIFAANTSAIPITKIASATNRATNVIGIHFMNPVPVKTMAEVIRGYHTSEETIEKTKSLLSTMGKECVIVNDSPGFVSNRVLMLTINEAIYLIQENVASADDVDQIFKSCFEHKMGPLETADLIGLDTILYSLDVLYENFNDSKYRPCPLLKMMVDAGLYGRKNGQGFYNYHTEF